MSFETPESELPRDRWGRPLITPPEGGEPVAYTRCTTFAGTLEDTYNLGKWKERMVAKGMGISPDLLLGAAAADAEDRFGKRTLNDIADKAIERANGSAKATAGTALHTLSEKVDRGEDLGYVPETFVPDLAAYKQIVADNGLKMLAIERFCVMDEFRVGGTYDRLIDLPEDLTAPDGSRPGAEGLAVIGDLKTGNVDFGLGKIAMQLSTYAHSLDYDHRDGSRSPIGGAEGRVSRKWGVVIHLPAGTGTAHLLWVNLAPARLALDLARDVRDYRSSTRSLSTRFATAAPGAVAAPASLAEQVRTAGSYAALRALYNAHKAAWTPGLTSLATETAVKNGWKN